MFRIDICHWRLLNLLDLILLRGGTLEAWRFGRSIGVSTAFVIRGAIFCSGSFRVYASVLLRRRTVYAADLGNTVIKLSLLFSITEFVSIKLVILLFVILPWSWGDVVSVANCFDAVPLL
jgi:hypothetical protein